MFLNFRKGTFLAQNIKKVPYIFSKESFYYILSKEGLSYISKNGNLQFSAQALKIKELHLGKIDYDSGNRNPKKASDISRNGILAENFLKSWEFSEELRIFL